MKTKANQPFSIIVVALLVVGGGAGFWAFRRAARTASPDSEAEVSEGSRPGGRGPSSAVGMVGPGAAPIGPEANDKNPAWIKAKAQIAEVMAKAPTTLSPHAVIEPFDASSFESNSESYLAKIVPARCFQTAKGGPDVPALRAVDSLRTETTHGQPTQLAVITTPNAPVTFTAFAGGYFTENGVSSVSVRADARGYAAVHYTADRGVVGDTTVVAGSPTSAGTQRFMIRMNEAPLRL